MNKSSLATLTTYDTKVSTSEAAEAAVGGGRGGPGQCQTWEIILMNYTAVVLMFFILLFFQLVKMFLKKVVDVKTKEMRVLREITEAVLQITLLIQSSSFTWQTRGFWGVLDALEEQQQQQEWLIS